MKKTFYLLLFFLLVCVTPGFSQDPPVYPIPSYGVQITEMTFFKWVSLTSPAHLDGKKKINVSVHGMVPANATVVIFSLDGQDRLGPYVISAGETLTIEVDDREWGVMVDSEYTVEVDVWYSI